MSIYSCCDQLRRSALERKEVKTNGIDYVEVLDDPSLPQYLRRGVILLHLFKPAPLDSPIGDGIPDSEKTLTADNILIDGGERLKDVSVVDLKIIPEDRRMLRLVLNHPGDLSLYRLRIVRNRKDLNDPGARMDGFDPVLYEVYFRFKVECSDLECRDVRVCPLGAAEEPEINYLAKDYASFRQLMLDRMSLIMPQWKERSPADLGIVLVEVLAYVGDYLSYRQDAVATEAYLGMARHRISVRRHARLVDYFMHDGCNSRVWVQVQVDSDIIGDDQNPALPKGTQLLTSLDGQPPRLPKGSLLADSALAVFETMHNVRNLFRSSNVMEFYTWGSRRCCLPKGSTRATLLGDHSSRLKPGDVLIFEEVQGPKTGHREDADASHRHVVCLTSVQDDSDPLGSILSGIPGGPVKVTNIEWGDEDALPFPLCISEETDKGQTKIWIKNVSVALGNIVLADHGGRVRVRPDQGVDAASVIPALKEKLKEQGYSLDNLESLGDVPGHTLYRVPSSRGDRCLDAGPMSVKPRFNPGLMKGPLTYVRSLPLTNDGFLMNDGSSASALVHRDVSLDSLQDVLPALLILDDQGNPWNPKRDLISSRDFDKAFVVEVDDDGFAYIRFGDGIQGVIPKEGVKFYATYRIGNGASGNIGPDSIAHIISDNPGIVKVRNPLPAMGGTEPESMEMVRMNAPNAFSVQERAVTEEDYASIAERFPGVKRAAATFHWTGGWRTVFLVVEKNLRAIKDDNFSANLRQHMENFRMAGQDLEIEDPVYVSLEIEMIVCIKPDYFKDQVRDALLDIFSNRALPDGRKGLFYPDNFSFGQPVYLSRLYAEAMNVEGVSSASIDIFQRQGVPGSQGIDSGKLIMDRLEIARLDNDPNFPEHGVFRLNVIGGK